MLSSNRIGLLLVLLLLSGNVLRSEELICCGAAEVFIISAETTAKNVEARRWRWTASESPEIPVAMRRQFATTDECKPYAGKILITSSSGGVALVEESTKKTLFFTSARNAHSACLLPKNRVAVASSFGGDELLVFDMAKSQEKLAPLAKLPLVGAHGALWDANRQRLWALGNDELLLIEIQDVGNEIKLIVESRAALPAKGGHDLSPSRNERFLFVTSEPDVYRFDKRTGRFEQFAPLAKQPDVKSIHEHPKSGRIVYHQADHAKKTWWSDTIRWLEPPDAVQLPGERLYKVRWNVALPEPEAATAK